MLSNQKLLFIHLNEVNFDYLIRKSKKYNSKNILSLLKNKIKIKTISPDKTQDKNLDPWVQSVSINSGIISETHKIFNIGDVVPKNTIQIWDILVNNKISCSVWGTMNSLYKKNKFLKLYFPDPWNYNAVAYPEKLNKLLYLPKYYAQNYLDYRNFKFFLMVINFAINILFSRFFNFFLRNFLFFFKNILRSGLRNFQLFFIFDLISLFFFKNVVKKNKSQFALIFLNSFAHYQHNNWDEIKNEKTYFDYADLFFKELKEMEKFYKNIIIVNGFTQKKIKTEYTIRPYNPRVFLNYIDINFLKLEQNMTNGGFIYFKSKNIRNISIKKMNEIKIFGNKFFDLKIIDEKKISYKIIVSTNKVINEFNYYKININNFEKYFKIKNKKPLTSQISAFFKKEDFWRKLFFIKTTGKHVSNGEIYFNLDKKISTNKEIKNHKIFNIVKNFFSV
jgi:hypothetical protein